MEIIVNTVLTEKALSFQELERQYRFIVNLDATKEDVKNAVQRLFKVNVLAVRTLVKPLRRKRTKVGMSKKRLRKYAIVTLQEGQKINFN